MFYRSNPAVVSTDAPAIVSDAVGDLPAKTQRRVGGKTGAYARHLATWLKGQAHARFAARGLSVAEPVAITGPGSEAFAPGTVDLMPAMRALSTVRPAAPKPAADIVQRGDVRPGDLLILHGYEYPGKTYQIVDVVKMSGDGDVYATTNEIVENGTRPVDARWYYGVFNESGIGYKLLTDRSRIADMIQSRRARLYQTKREEEQKAEEESKASTNAPWLADLIAKVTTKRNDVADAKAIMRYLKAHGVESSITVRRYSMARGLNFDPKKGKQWTQEDARIINDLVIGQVGERTDYEKNERYLRVDDDIHPRAKEDRSDSMSDYYDPGGVRIPIQYAPEMLVCLADAYQRAGEPLTPEGERILKEAQAKPVRAAAPTYAPRPTYAAPAPEPATAPIVNLPPNTYNIDRSSGTATAHAILFPEGQRLVWNAVNPDYQIIPNKATVIRALEYVKAHGDDGVQVLHGDIHYREIADWLSAGPLLHIVRYPDPVQGKVTYNQTAPWYGLSDLGEQYLARYTEAAEATKRDILAKHYQSAPSAYRTAPLAPVAMPAPAPSPAYTPAAFTSANRYSVRYVKEAGDWVNLGIVEIATGKPLRYGWNTAQQRWNYQGAPPAEILADAVAAGLPAEAAETDTARKPLADDRRPSSPDVLAAGEDDYSPTLGRGRAIAVSRPAPPAPAAPPSHGPKLRALADGMQTAIDDKLRGGATSGQNWTPRRAGIMDSMRADGMRMLKVQTALRGIADLQDSGEAAAYDLGGVKTKADVERMVSAIRQNEHRAQYADKPLPLDKAQRKVAEILSGVKPAAAAPDNSWRRHIGQIPGFVPTPPDLAARMAAIAYDTIDIHAPRILEPEAGNGHLVDAALLQWPNGTVTAIEANSTLDDMLRKKYAGNKRVTVHHGDIMDFNIGDSYDIVLMNPPFENGADIDHVRYAFTALENGGVLVAIMSEGPFFRSDKKAVAFRDWLSRFGAYASSEKLPDAFKGYGVGVAARLVVIQREDDMMTESY